MDKFKPIVMRYAPVLLVLVLIAIICMIGYIWYNSKHKQNLHKPVVMTQEQVKHPVKLANALHITKDEAEQVISKKGKAEPVVTYYVQAPTVEKAAEITKQDIVKNDPNLPKEVTEKSDRTAVVANADEQKVDVYKINLNKAHRVIGGITVMNDKIYETVGYQAGDFQGLAHFNGKHFEGASALYTFAKW